MINRKYQAFTRVETIIVLGVVFLLLATALPAVQRAREDSRSVKCKNNLKLMGLAIHNYHDVHQMFPPGWISKRMEGEGHPSTGWQSMILPYIDEAPLYNRLDLTEPVYSTRDQTLLKKPIEYYRCPMDSTPSENPIRGEWGTSNYVGNYGAIPIPRWSASQTNTAFWPGNSTAVLSIENEKLYGMFRLNRGTRIREILDGTSNTLMIGEKDIQGGAAIWPGPRSNYHESDVVSDASFATPLNKSQYGFSSRHDGFVQFTLCDGAVRAISLDIDSREFETPEQMGTLQKLAAKDDGQRIESF